ncbi:hypothetical protein PM082_009937 [Marasmius tenuissimus]|nr:hypothetical protein PM082_009937 [Marasmius tenuissimus]
MDEKTADNPAIHKMPVEIMVHILNYMIGEDNCDTFGSRTTRKDEPIPWSVVGWVSRICRRWRDIILSKPDFWAFISLYVDFNDTYDRRAVNRLKQHLSRSGNALLNVEFIFEQWGPPFDQHKMPIFKAFLQPVLTEAHRWRHLRFKGWNFSDDFTKYILQPLKNQLSSLESFELIVRRMDDWDLLVAFRDALGPSNTCFQTLHLHTEDARLLHLDSLAQFPGRFSPGSIRYLYLDNPLHASLAFIFLCPNLVTAHFVIPSLGCRHHWVNLPRRGPQFAEVAANAPCRLPYLTELTVEVTYMSATRADYSYEDVACIFASIEAPGLASLTLLSDSKRLQDPIDLGALDGREAFTSSLYTMLSKSEGGLDRLRISDVPIRDDELIALLGRLPGLKCLEVKEIDRVKISETKSNSGGYLDSDCDEDNPEGRDADDENDGPERPKPKPNTIFTTKLLSWLTWSAERTHLPQLRAIRLTFRDFKNLQASFEGMLESRLAPPDHLPTHHSPHKRFLDSARLKFTQEGYGKYDWSQMKGLQAKGLAIWVLFQWIIDEDDPYDEEEEDKYHDPDERVLVQLS